MIVSDIDDDLLIILLFNFIFLVFKLLFKIIVFL